MHGSWVPTYWQRVDLINIKMEPKSYFNKTTFPIIILNNVLFYFFWGRGCTWDSYYKLSLERMGDIYQLLILSLVIGKASSRIASVTEFILHVTHYIPLLATVLKIIHLWYKTRPYSNCLISIHLMDNL